MMPEKDTRPSCMDCMLAKVVPDPDPDDWFCDDDVAVECLASGNSPERHVSGSYQMGDPMVTVGCRPYNTRKETTPIPEWCPHGGKPVGRGH